MKTKEQVEKDFRDDLNNLLKKHRAQINLSQRGKAYMEYDVIEVSIEAEYDEENLEMISPYFDFEL